MLLSTKQVRAVARLAQIQHVHTYTDRTLKTKANISNPRRSVVFVFYSSAQADALYSFLRTVIKNPIKRSGSVANYATRNSGLQYVRVIANI
jgi:hypothetical protein